MKNKKNLLQNAKLLAGIVAAVAVIFLIICFVAKDNMVVLALSISLCLSAFIISGWLLAGGLRDDATHYNYFLYDRDTKRSVSDKDLTFELANTNLSLYLADYVPNPLMLWEGVPVALREQLKAGSFRVPVAYRMLYELSLLEPNEILRYFGDSSEVIVHFVCRTISDAGDKDMADYIFNLKRRFDEQDQANVANFFTRNRRCFEGRLLNYIKNNLDRYVMKK